MPLGVKSRTTIQLGTCPSLTSMSCMSFAGTDDAILESWVPDIDTWQLLSCYVPVSYWLCLSHCSKWYILAHLILKTRVYIFLHSFLRTKKTFSEVSDRFPLTSHLPMPKQAFTERNAWLRKSNQNSSPKYGEGNYNSEELEQNQNLGCAGRKVGRGQAVG